MGEDVTVGGHMFQNWVPVEEVKHYDDRLTLCDYLSTKLVRTRSKFPNATQKCHIHIDRAGLFLSGSNHGSSSFETNHCIMAWHGCHPLNYDHARTSLNVKPSHAPSMLLLPEAKEDHRVYQHKKHQSVK
jgi:hypothetical protein